MADAGLEIPPGYVRHGPHVRDGGAAPRRASCVGRRDPPTAIFASSDTQALGVLEAARTAGLRVPGDVSVVGFDDVEVSGYVGLTTVRQPLFESGALGARLLLEALGGEGRPLGECTSCRLELVERSTTAPRPRVTETGP